MFPNNIFLTVSWVKDTERDQYTTLFEFLYFFMLSKRWIFAFLLTVLFSWCLNRTWTLEINTGVCLGSTCVINVQVFCQVLQAAHQHTSWRHCFCLLVNLWLTAAHNVMRTICSILYHAELNLAYCQKPLPQSAYRKPGGNKVYINTCWTEKHRIKSSSFKKKKCKLLLSKFCSKLKFQSTAGK